MDSKQMVGRDMRRQEHEIEKMANLPEELEREIQELDRLFWVDEKKLKGITDRFIEELDEGLQEFGRNIVADGSVANKHPKFKKRWAAALGEILDWPENRKEDPIKLTSAEDGSGIGVAVITAMTWDRMGRGDTVGINPRYLKK